MSYFNYHGKRIYYTEFGTGSPLLFLHGNTASSNMFAQVAEQYRNDFKCILIDFLGHGQSERLDEFPADLWFFEAEQTIAFLRERYDTKVNIIGSSGGALAAVNVALEAPELVDKVIADSFEGEVPLKTYVKQIEADRAQSKQDEDTRLFYYYMHGDDWETIVDHDTSAIVRHEKEIGKFFRRELSTLKPDILLTGSKEDEFVSLVRPDFFEVVYGELIQKIGHGSVHLFPNGGHPAILSNPEEFYKLSMEFLNS